MPINWELFFTFLGLSLVGILLSLPQILLKRQFNIFNDYMDQFIHVDNIYTLHTECFLVVIKKALKKSGTEKITEQVYSQYSKYFFQKYAAFLNQSEYSTEEKIQRLKKVQRLFVASEIDKEELSFEEAIKKLEGKVKL